MKKIFVIITVIAISLTSLVFSIEMNAYNKSYYMGKYKENNVSNVTGKSMEELGTITDDLILYLKGGSNDLLEPHFNSREVMHMEDVRSLFDLARTIKYLGMVSIIVAVFYFLKNKKLLKLANTIFCGLFVNHSLLAIISILAYNNFNKYFTYFHLVFFSNDLWILNPETDLMIQMLPENFFSGMALNILITFLIFLSLLQVVSLIYKNRNKPKSDRVK